MDYKKTRLKKVLRTHSDLLIKDGIDNFRLALKLSIVPLLFYNIYDDWDDIDKDNIRDMSLFGLGTLAAQIIITIIFLSWWVSLFITLTVSYVMLYMMGMAVNIYQKMEDVELTTKEKRNHKINSIL